MLKLVVYLIVLVFGLTLVSGAGEKAEKSFYDFTVRDIDGREIKLETYAGKVLLVVNVASKCGFTHQYEGLERIYNRYKDDGLVVLGFPANNFANQEPGSEAEIRQFCTLNYGVSFPMFSKISVRGRNIAPLYRFLTGKQTNPEYAGKISWNFNKFLVSREGEIVGRFGTKTDPEDEQLIRAVEQYLHQ